MIRPTRHVPADLLAGLLERAPRVGWEGPVLRIHGDDNPNCSEPVRGTHGVVIDKWSPQRSVVDVYWPSIRKCVARPVSDLGLPLDRIEALLQVARVLAAGQLCLASTGHVTSPSPPNENGCPTCRGTGFVRLPAPVWHLMPRALGGLLSSGLDRFAGELICCSTWRVAAGLGPVVGVERALDPVNSRFTGLHFAGASTWWTATEADRDHFLWHGNRHVGWAHGDASGPEVGQAALKILNAQALAEGYAVRHADHLDLPWPD